MSKEQAKIAAREYAERYRTGWSDSLNVIEESVFDGRMCLIVHTSSAEIEGRSWMDFETTTPVDIYVDARTGKCFGHRYGNRSFNYRD